MDSVNLTKNYSCRCPIVYIDIWKKK